MQKVFSLKYGRGIIIEFPPFNFNEEYLVSCCDE
jgi:hypothetical protein